MEAGSRSTELVALGPPRLRPEGHFYEALAVKIRDDVAQVLELPPDKVQETLEQEARGGITITATAAQSSRDDAASS